MKLIREGQQGMFSLQAVTDLSAADRSPASRLPFPVYLAAVFSQALSKDNTRSIQSFSVMLRSTMRLMQTFKTLIKQLPKLFGHISYA